MRVGYFGGTFDPPHLGHLAVARAAVEAFALDRLLLTPTSKQPLKEAVPGASYDDRLAMVSLLCEGESMFEPSALEAPTADVGANYTIDTLRKLRATLGANDDILVVVGADSFLDIRRWREPDALLAEAEWIVVSRPGFSLDDLAPLRLTEEQLSKVRLLTGVDVPISATELRAKLRNGEDCSAMVPARVLKYIESRDLYRQS